MHGVLDARPGLFRRTVLIGALSALPLIASAQTPPPPASTTQPATQPAAKPATKPNAKPNAKPMAKPAAKPMAKPNAQQAAVLEELGKLGGKPIETLTPVEARKQPSPADAVKALLTRQGKPTTPEAVGKVEDRTFQGPGGSLPLRIYTPVGKGPFPVVLYLHGGGWVIADLDTYDASPRALANAAGAVVVSAHYRQAPEHKFPAAHEDAMAAYQWVLENAAGIDGDPKRVAVVGESAGGNLAANVAIMARDKGLTQPLRQVLVYPVADDDMNSPSYLENAKAKPLNKPMMQWFAQHYFASMQQAADPRISLVDQPNLKGVAPATIITAQIDPLRSDGEKYAAALKKAGVAVNHVNYDGVAHEFFGMGAVIDKAKAAQKVAGDDLKKSFSGK